MAIGVVDAFEVIDIENHEHQLGVAFLRFSQHILGQFHEQAAVHQLGEGVGLGELGETGQEGASEQQPQQQCQRHGDGQADQQVDQQVLQQAGVQEAEVVVDDRQIALAAAAEIRSRLLNRAHDGEAAEMKLEVGAVEVDAVVIAAAEAAHNVGERWVVGLGLIDQRIGDLQLAPARPGAVDDLASLIDKEQEVEAIGVVLLRRAGVGGDQGLPLLIGQIDRQGGGHQAAAVFGIGDHGPLPLQEAEGQQREAEQQAGQHAETHHQRPQQVGGAIPGRPGDLHQPAPLSLSCRLSCSRASCSRRWASCSAIRKASASGAASVAVSR